MIAEGKQQAVRVSFVLYSFLIFLLIPIFPQASTRQAWKLSAGGHSGPGAPKSLLPPIAAHGLLLARRRYSAMTTAKGEMVGFELPIQMPLCQDLTANYHRI